MSRFSFSFYDSPHECLTNKALMSFTFYVIPLLCRVNALSGIHDLPAYLSTSLLEPLHRLYSIFALSMNVLYNVNTHDLNLRWAQGEGWIKYCPLPTLLQIGVSLSQLVPLIPLP